MKGFSSIKHSVYSIFNRSQTLFFALIVINILLVIDTSIVRISSFTGGLYPFNNYVLLFMVISAAYLTATIVVMRLPKREFHGKSGFSLTVVKSFLAGIIGSQYIILFFIILLILQVLTNKVYSLWLFKAISFNSYLIGVIMLGVLSFKILSWFRKNRSLLLLFYFCGITLMCLNSILIISSLQIELRSKPELINYSRNVSGGSSPYMGDLESLREYVLIGSFSFIWLATLFLMKNYSNRFAQVRFWIIMIIAIIYFVGEFEPFFFNLFVNLSSVIPAMADIGYSIFIGATRPAAGILFGLVFWIISRSIESKVIKEYMLISGFGMMLLFASNQPAGLSLTPLPPFSLITAGFYGLSSYLLFIGLYSSAVSVSHDSAIRNKAKSYARQLVFLDKIGTPEMKQFTESLVNKAMNDLKRNAADLEYESGVSPSIDEQNFKEYLKMVMKEVKREK